MLCPKCNGKTETVVYDEVRVDRCKHCGGLWFDTGELEALREDNWMADYVIDTGDKATGRRYNRVEAAGCPRCGAQMVEDSDPEQPHILFERCPEGHGTFLDAGEFTDLVHKTFWDRFKRPA